MRDHRINDHANVNDRLGPTVGRLNATLRHTFTHYVTTPQWGRLMPVHSSQLSHWIELSCKEFVNLCHILLCIFFSWLPSIRCELRCTFDWTWRTAPLFSRGEKGPWVSFQTRKMKCMTAGKGQKTPSSSATPSPRCPSAKSLRRLPPHPSYYLCSHYVTPHRPSLEQSPFHECPLCTF